MVSRATTSGRVAGGISLLTPKLDVIQGSHLITSTSINCPNCSADRHYFVSLLEYLL